MLPTFYQLRRIITRKKERKKERMEKRKTRSISAEHVFFDSLGRQNIPFVGIQGLTERDKTNCVSLPPLECLQKKKTLVFAPSSPILPLVRLYIFCTKMNFCFTRNILGIINLLRISISNNLRILDNSTKREKSQSLNNNSNQVLVLFLRCTEWIRSQ